MQLGAVSESYAAFCETRGLRYLGHHNLELDTVSALGISTPRKQYITALHNEWPYLPYGGTPINTGDMAWDQSGPQVCIYILPSRVLMYVCCSISSTQVS